MPVDHEPVAYEPATDGPETTAPRGRVAGIWSRRHRFAVARWVALVLGLVLVGAALTYLIAPPVAGHERVVQFSGDSLTNADTAATRQVMPSVTGLSAETLRVVLRDAGAADVEVVTKTAPAPGPPGRITTQEPAAGEPIGQRVTVTTSTPMVMPDVTGKDFAAVRADLQRKGAVVRVTPVVRPGAKIGTVLDSVPPSGSTVPTVVTLSVADPGQSLALSDLREQDSSDCTGSSSITLGEQTGLGGIECRLAPGSTSFVEYTLDGNALSLAFTLGYDASAGRGSAVARIVADGKQLARLPVAEAPAQHRVDVSGVGTLRLEVGGNVTSSDNPPVIAFGDAVLQGQPAKIDALAGQ